MVDGSHIDRGFWRNRRVLLTGHTGFKGAWLTLWLERLGAEVFGFALPPEQALCVFNLARCENGRGRFGDLRDADAVRDAVAWARPDVVIHMAAQALVGRGYAEPLATFSTNVAGTAHLLDSLRQSRTLRCVLVVTSDKVYDNDDRGRRFIEGDPLGGDDPYSASKACQEIVTHSFARSYFAQAGVPVATARAGNVIAGGDWAQDRLVSDVVRAAAAGEPITLRSPGATRPWQHVLDPLAGYLLYVQALAGGEPMPQALNFGPAESHPVETVVNELAELMGVTVSRRNDRAEALAESHRLGLDAGAAYDALGWQPLLDLPVALVWVADWHKQHNAGADMRAVSLAQIARYEERMQQ